MPARDWEELSAAIRAPEVKNALFHAVGRHSHQNQSSPLRRALNRLDEVESARQCRLSQRAAVVGKRE